MPETICVVDDNLVNRKLLTGILRKAGYGIIEAEDGEEALAVISRDLPDLVLLDIMMPKKDGFQVCQELKRDARTLNIPIIFLSAKTQAEDKIRGLELGAADYVTKPFDLGEVLARVQTQLKIARLTAALREANQDLIRQQRQMKEDLDAAGGIQRSLLPRSAPHMENVAVAWRFMPCESIGGDIFNIIRLDETRLAIYLLDVSGHGVPSALVTVSVSQLLQPHGGVLRKESIHPPDYEIRSPSEVLTLLDREYPIERFNRFFTITYLVLDEREGFVRYSNAGHPPPLLVRSDGSLEVLREGGAIIGMGSMIPFEEGERRLAAGDKLFLYTDGVAECEGNNGEAFGQERLYRTLHDLRNRPVDEIVDKVMATLTAFAKGNRPRDDVTLLGLEFGRKAG